MWDANIASCLQAAQDRMGTMVRQLECQTETISRFKSWIKRDRQAISHKKQELDAGLRSLYDMSDRVAELELRLISLRGKVRSITPTLLSVYHTA
jgi:hypothetical protein